MFRRCFALLAGVALLSVSNTAVGQQQGDIDFPPFPNFPQIQGLDLGVIADMQMVTGSSSRSISMTVENGVKKINAADNDVKAYIEEHPEGNLIVKVTRQYTKADLDELMNEEPELYMHLKSIPDKTDTAEVEVSVGVTKTYEAESADALHEAHPDVFEIYERFTTGNMVDLQNMQNGFPQIPHLRFHVAPQIQFDRVPDGIRIHPVPDEDDKNEKKKDGPDPDDEDA